VLDTLHQLQTSDSVRGTGSAVEDHSPFSDDDCAALIFFSGERACDPRPSPQCSSFAYSLTKTAL